MMRTLEEIKQMHPGLSLQKQIKAENMSQHDLAVRTGVTEKHISTIINGTKSISASFAKKLEYALGLDAKKWLSKQADYDYALAAFEEDYEITSEEINILATYMIVQWLGQQLASVENVRMKYSGSDFKFTSQANHMQKLLQLKKDYEREGFHLQRLYKRRFKDINGVFHTNMTKIMAPMQPLPGQRAPDDSWWDDDNLEWEDFENWNDGIGVNWYGV